jgi:hypothetical protein
MGGTSKNHTMEKNTNSPLENHCWVYHMTEKKRDDFRLRSQFLVLHLLNELNGHGPLNGTGIDG